MEPTPPPTTTATRTDEAAWLERWRQSEISHLARRVEELHRRLRRRTRALGCALGVILVLVGALAILLLRLRGVELLQFLVVRH